MSQLKATPGPWVIDNGDICQRTKHGLRVIATTSPPADGDEDANTHLIAAAPELYEALEAMLRAFDDRQIHPSFKPFPAVEAAEAALAKARGEA